MEEVVLTPYGSLRELLVLRHAKSAWDGETDDFDRPLAPRGRKHAPRMGRWIRAQGLVPDLVVSSTARRARETTELVLEELAPEGSAVTFDERLYLAGVGEIVSILAERASGPARVLVVGHNPGLESLVEHLTDAPIRPPDGTKPFPTAALARLAMPDDWSALERGSARLVELVRPRSLKG